MIKKKLEDFFGGYYKSPKKVEPISRVEKGYFGLADEKACGDCRRLYELECDKNVLFIDSGETTVKVVELESFIKGYAGLSSIPSYKICDSLIYSDGKVVFCEMTCSHPNYISSFETPGGVHKIGKRLTAFEQTRNSINILCAVPEVLSEIERRKEKVALFAFRKKSFDDIEDFDKKVIENMNAFELIQRTNADGMLLHVGYGFVFTEVCYPSVYAW